MTASPSTSRRGWVALAVVLAAAAALRLRHLGLESLWYDEVMSLEWGRLPWLEMLAVIRASDVHPPLYLALVHVWTDAFGASAVALRSLSAVAGLLGVWVAFRLGRALYDEGVGLGVALLLACSPYHIYYSQEGRSYALLALLALASYDQMVRLLQGRPHAAAGYVAATTLLAYAHVYGLFVIAAQNAYAVALWTAGRRGLLQPLRWLRLQVTVGALFLPWVVPLLLQVRFLTGGSWWWLWPPTGRNLLVSHVQHAGTMVALAVLAPLVALGTYAGLRQLAREDDPAPLAPEALLTLGWLSPHLFPFVLSHLVKPIYLTRSAIAALPFFLLLAACQLRRLPRILAVALTIGVAGWSAHAQVGYSAHPTREQWRELAAYVAANARPQDLVLFDAGYGRTPFNHYAPSAAFDRLSLPEDVLSPAGAKAARLAATGRERVFLVRFQRATEHAAVAGSLPGLGVAEIRPFVGLWLYRFERVDR